MNAENIQQERSYHGFIQDFSSLSKKIKEDENLPPLFDETKDESIYNTVVDFYAAKFLIAYGTSQEKGIDKVLKKELDKIKEAAQKLGDKAKQKLESEVREKLKGYIEGGIKEDGVKIYGNHASIKLEDNKKEFKISEFLNSDFCQKNGISGFSTLHSDGTSGMHGFVAEEGKEKEKRKVRHYVVTDGSYEMTLNWYANGEKCTIKINIDKDGIDLVERNGITDDQLKANKDVKIGGLFLHQIQFREKGQEKEVQYGKGGNQVQHEAYETVVRSNGRNIGQDIGVESSRKQRLSYDSGIKEDFNNKIYSQEAKEKRKHRQAAREENLGDKIYNLQSLFEENPQNKKAPPLPPPRISSLKKDVPDEQRGSKSVSHQDNRQKDEQYDNPTFTTFGYTASGEKETVAEEALQVKSAALVPPTQDVALKKVEDTFKSKDVKESGNTGDKQPLNDVASILARKAEIEFLSGIEEDFNNEINSQKAKEKRERRQVAREENLGDKIYNLQSLFEENSQNKKTPPPPPHRISPLNKDISDKKRDLDHQNDGQRNEQEKGGDLFQDIRNFKKNNLQHVDGRKALIEKSDKNDSSIDIKTNDSGYSSPITDQSQFQVDPKSLTRELEALNHKEEDKLSGEYGKNSKDHDTEKNIPKDSFSENILQKIKEDKPIYKWLKDKIEGKEDNQNLDALEEKLSQKSGQGNIVEKRENDGGKPLSTDGNEEVWYDALEDLTGLDEDEYFDAVEDLNEQKINQSTNPADQAMDKQEVEHNSDRPTSPVNTEENVDVEQSKNTLLTEFTNKLNKETKKFPLKPVDQKEMSEQTRERLLKDKLLKDDSTDVKKVAEQENTDTSLIIDKNSELSKLLARDEKQLKVGAIEEEREDTLVEHTNSHDRNRIALGNKNRLLWTKHVKQQQENKDKGISI